MPFRALNPFSFLFVGSKREQVIAQYVIPAHARGRALEEILADRYVRNRATPLECARALERPELIAAIGDDTVTEMRLALETGGPLAAVRW
jgi:hypothetical protein